jgi:hypothetical protein
MDFMMLGDDKVGRRLGEGVFELEFEDLVDFKRYKTSEGLGEGDLGHVDHGGLRVGVIGYV